MSGAGTQVLHESAVAPVRAAQIPLQIRSTFAPELPGTRIGFEAGAGLEETGVVGFAGRRAVSMLRVLFREAARADADTLVRACLAQQGIAVFHSSQGVEGLCLLLIAKPGQDALHAACDEVRRLLPCAQVKLRENLAALLALAGRRGRFRSWLLQWNLPAFRSTIWSRRRPGHCSASTTASTKPHCARHTRSHSAEHLLFGSAVIQ